RTVAAATWGIATLTDLASGRELQRWSFSPGEARTLGLKKALRSSQKMAASPDGRLIALGCSGGLIHVWDVTTGHHIGQLRGHLTPVTGVAFSPDGRLLASCGGAIKEDNHVDMALEARRAAVLRA